MIFTNLSQAWREVWNLPGEWFCLALQMFQVIRITRTIFADISAISTITIYKCFKWLPSPSFFLSSSTNISSINVPIYQYYYHHHHEHMTSSHHNLPLFKWYHHYFFCRFLWTRTLLPKVLQLRWGPQQAKVSNHLDSLFILQKKIMMLKTLWIWA